MRFGEVVRVNPYLEKRQIEEAPFKTLLIPSAPSSVSFIQYIDGSLVFNHQDIEKRKPEGTTVKA